MNIFGAALSGDMSTIRSLVRGGMLRSGNSVNSVRSDGFSPLMLAAENGHLDVVNYLISEGADVNHSKPSGYTALMDAADEGHHEVVKALLDAGANPNCSLHKNNYTPLIFACRKGYCSVARSLIKHGASLDHQDTDKGFSSALVHAIAWVNFDCIDLLVQSGANVDIRDSQGRTPLMWAALGDFFRAADVLIAHGANINAVDNSGNNVLMHARSSRLLLNNVSYLLIDAGADDSYYEPVVEGMKEVLNGLEFKPSETNWGEETARWREKTNTNAMHANYENTMKAILFLTVLQRLEGSNANAVDFQRMNAEIENLNKLKEQVAGLLGGNIEPSDEYLMKLQPMFDHTEQLSRMLGSVCRS